VASAKRLMWILRVQVFVSGAMVMALELLGSRFLIPHFGSTLYVWGSLIGVVLAALSLGYYHGGRIADRRPSFQAFAFIIFSAGVYILFINTLAPMVFEFALSLRMGERFSPLAATVLLLALPSWLLGMVSPYAIRLGAKTLKEIGSLAGNLYSLSTAGSIVGTFLTAFVLIPELGVAKTLYGVSIGLMAVSTLSLTNRGKSLAVVVISLALAMAFTAPVKASGVVFEGESAYHHIVVMDNNVTGVRTLLLDNNFHSAMDLREPSRIVYTYTGFFHLGFLFNPEVENVLFIGGGGFSGPKRFLEDYDWVKVDVVEIDPQVVRVAEEYFGLKPDPRLKVYIQDGRVYLASSEKKYDLVVMDTYDKSFIPFHLMTLEFWREMERDLKPQGVVVLNFISSLEGDASRILKAELATMSEVFPEIYLFPLSPGMPSLVQNIIIVAVKAEKNFSQETLVERAEELHFVRVPIQSYANHLWEPSFKLEGGRVLTDDKAPVENLLNPLTGKPLVREEGEATVLRENAEVPLSTKPVGTPTVLSFLAVGLGILLALEIFLFGRQRSTAT